MGEDKAHDIARLLESFAVRVENTVAWGEMDAFQHVNNIVYFRYFENARIAYFRELRLMEMMTETGIGPILKSTDCNFKLRLTYPDTVTVGARTTDIGTDQFLMQYRVVSHRHGKVAAEGEGLLVTFDYREGHKAPVPDALRQKIRAIEGKLS